MMPKNDGCKVFIAMAGLAAALPGAVAALDYKASYWCSMRWKVPFDSLLSIVQLPPGVPAATVGVDRGDNAGYLLHKCSHLRMMNMQQLSNKTSSTKSNELRPKTVKSTGEFEMFDSPEFIENPLNH